MGKLIAIIILIGVWQAAIAKQSKYYNNQELLTFNIAKKELTHIAVENDRITGLKMSNDLLEVEQNEKSGELFVRAKTESFEPITLFITTEQGRTIGLRLTPKNIAAESILVKFKEELTTVNELNELGSHREQQIINILKALAAGSEVEELANLPKLTNKLKTIAATSYTQQSLKGQRLVLKNTTKEQVALQETEFAGNSIQAVALSKLKIEPNETVELYIIKELD